MPPIRIFAGLAILGTAVSLQPAARAADAAIAIKKGAEYLDGQFARGTDLNTNEFKTGGTALSGIALLEAGIKPDSPGLAAIVKSIRSEALAQTETYYVALCILFLDKLAEKTGDATDEGIIQILGVRLYAGLNSSGGWGYSTWDAENPQELARLATALKKNELSTQPNDKPAEKPVEAPKKPDDGFLKPSVPANRSVNGKIHPEASRLLQNVQQAIRARGRAGVGDDNSNTQFGLIGLWVAARHGLVANDAFALVEAHFLSAQNQQDAGWGYSSIMTGIGGLGSSSPAMTCAGLLGLAVGAGARNALVTDAKKDKPVEPGKPTGDDPFSNPKNKLPKPAAGKGVGKPAEAALFTLGKFLGATRAQANAGRNPGRGEPGDPDQGFGALRNFVSAGNAYYLLWSVERVAMAYGLDTIGEVDWYDWGCGHLLPNQTADGSWGTDKYGAIVNTSFALLFLTKSNSVRDLSNKNKGKVRDPGKTELRAGGGANTPPLFAPPPKEGSKTETRPDPKSAGPAFTLPAVVSPNDEAEIEKVTTALATATDGDWKVKLEEARDAKGSKWTRGLVLACGRLEAERKQQARDALADRLTRMTVKSLREMLADPDPELRRAACLAVAMKDEKLLIPALIERITDPSDIVVRAAKASLKSISQTDFGPPNGADEEVKLKAAATWRAWYEALPK